MPAEFVTDGGAGVPALAKALGAAAGAPYDERRTWYDTFDWLLYDAGLLLEHHDSRRGSWLTLSGLDGEQLARIPFEAEVTVENLPDGVIRDRVAARTGIRALLPRATVDSTVTELVVLDDLDKTVCRVEVELPGRVRIEPLRGYAKAARKTAKALAALDGVSEASQPLFREAFTASGVDPAGYRSKPEPVRGRKQPAGLAYGVLFGQLLEILRANVDGTIRQLDTEFLHDLRVSVRRARSLVKVSADVLPDDLRAKFGTELKWIGDATSTCRDLDVYLLGFDAMAAQVPEPQTLEPFRTLLVRHRRQAHTGLNRALRSARFRKLTETWETAVGTTGGEPVGGLADRLLHRAWRRVVKRGDAITDESPAEDLHDLRKRCKELRYLLEFFAGLYDAGAHGTILTELKKLQDNLGEFQDSESQRLLVLHHAEELGSGAGVDTMLSMGRLEGQLEGRQTAAREHFADTWARFGNPRNRRLVEGLVRR